jgi:hypothetical protein
LIAPAAERAAIGADGIGPVEVREHEDVEELGAWSRAEGVEALAKPAL